MNASEKKAGLFFLTRRNVKALVDTLWHLGLDENGLPVYRSTLKSLTLEAGGVLPPSPFLATGVIWNIQTEEETRVWIKPLTLGGRVITRCSDCGRGSECYHVWRVAEAVLAHLDGEDPFDSQLHTTRTYSYGDVAF